MHALPEPTLSDFVTHQNARKNLFTAGPASLLVENLTSLQPCFGRGDQQYQQIEDRVMANLRAMTGHQHLVRLQGSATLALEIALRNFLTGRVLVVNSGFYAQRLLEMALAIRGPARDDGGISEVHSLSLDEITTFDGRADWVVACYTETSAGLRLPITDLHALARRTGAQLLVDSTASIGLEPGHEQADVIAYSSCKGLFGLTGAAFIGSHRLPQRPVQSFYLNHTTHRERRITGPYHAILSLADVLPRHEEFRYSVMANKQRCLALMKEHLCVPSQWQPLLCTRLNRRVRALDPRSILYESRLPQAGSIICHLGEVHLGLQARGAILDDLEVLA